MVINQNSYQELIEELGSNVTLVAVSKVQPVSSIQKLYNYGQRVFGENYVQELVDKYGQLPQDIQWHFIGHLQTNKVKYIAPFVHLIHGVDSLKLLKEINKQGEKNKRVIQVLLQVHIAQEETKFGMDELELEEALDMWRDLGLKNIAICGLMGMASFTEATQQVKEEFSYLKRIFEKYKALHPSLTILSMGMSGDYKLAINEGSTMVRLGSLLFGARMKK